MWLASTGNNSARCIVACFHSATILLPPLQLTKMLKAVCEPKPAAVGSKDAAELAASIDAVWGEVQRYGPIPVLNITDVSAKERSGDYL